MKKNQHCKCMSFATNDSQQKYFMIRMYLVMSAEKSRNHWSDDFYIIQIKVNVDNITTAYNISDL